VDSDAGQKADRLRKIFVQGTRLSLVTVLPLGASLFLLAAPLIHAWVGPKFEESIIVTQILIAVVAVRVGSSTATTVLKGAGRHRLLAFANSGTALVNVGLSLLWIRHYGLIGQAMGTLIPVAFTSIFILWPAACRRVGIGPGAAFVQAVWPTLWPVAVMALVVIPLRQALPERLFAVALTGGIGALCYLATFLAFAVKRDERRIYIAKAGELARSRRRVPAAA
jgi:O-antigen/teichoic acid export membrane protein